MKIHEVEKETGITKQNIRYYEKKGLLRPDRNQENDYREYSQEDVKSLKTIKLFRKLDMSIEDIKKLLYHDISLQEAIAGQKELLTKEQERLSAAIAFCEKITETEISALDVDRYLLEMEAEERRGASFADVLNDYKKVVKAKEQMEFTFTPDTMCLNAREFTEALCQYGTENNLNLVITKEGMYPEFAIDGVEYTAERYFGRFGAVVHCYMKHPKEAIPEGMSEERFKKYSLARRIAVALGISLFLFVSAQITNAKELLIAVPAVFAMALCWERCRSYYHNLKD